MKAKLIVILGPTAVGKSDLALDIATAINGAIVNADSQQVYRYLDIGTGKPTLAERRRVAHYLVDVIDPDEEFNAAIFSRLARQTIEHLRADQKNALVCGGTGLYVKALTQGLFDGPGQDSELRRALKQRILTEGIEPLYRWLAEIDPLVAARIHPHDRQRIIRALEVYQLTGRRLSDWQAEHGFQERRFEVCKIGLNRPRPELYDRINRRCERMVKDGLLEELRDLVARGYGLALKSLRSVGYRQMGQVLEGRQALYDGLKEMQQETRRLAKRQLTWFRRDQDIIWFHPEQKSEVIESVQRFLAS